MIAIALSDLGEEVWVRQHALLLRIRRSMILEWDHRLWAAMPREMLLREVIHHCDWWEKFNGTS